MGTPVDREEATLARTPVSGVQAVAENFDLDPVHAAEISRAIIAGRLVPAPLDPPPLPGSVARVALHIAAVDQPLILTAKATNRSNEHGVLLRMRPIDDENYALLHRIAAMFPSRPSITEESVTRQFPRDSIEPDTIQPDTIKEDRMFPPPEQGDYVSTGLSVEVTFDFLAEAHAETVRKRHTQETVVDGKPMFSQTAKTRTAETRIRRPSPPDTLPSLIDSYADDDDPSESSTLIKRSERNACMPPPLPGHEEAVSFGRYQLLERIGAGSMAAVHRGRIVSTGGFERQVAIKVMHQHLSDDLRFRNMFLDEARLAARIHHPNVVGTIDVLQDGETMMLVMQYVAGPTLRDMLRVADEKELLMPLGLSVRIATDMLAGLHAAHETVNDDGAPLNLVHRDVSPPNILVGRDGVARVSDFGVALAEVRLTKTQTKAIKGKVPYMPPEQAMSGDVDRRADVYGAGVVLWEMLTGERLFHDANEMRLLHEVLQGANRSPKEVAPSVPQAISDVCMRALSLEPDERYASTAEFAEALEEAAKKCGVRIATSRELSTFVKATEHGELVSLSDSLYPDQPSPLRSSDAPVTLARLSAPPQRRSVLRPALMGIMATVFVVIGALLGAKSYGLDSQLPALQALTPQSVEFTAQATTLPIQSADEVLESVTEMAEQTKPKAKPKTWKPRPKAPATPETKPADLAAALAAPPATAPPSP